MTISEQPALPVDTIDFRNVIGHFASGVAVITCETQNEVFGMTASAVSSVSLDPPTLLICLNLGTATQTAVQAEKKFAVNILHADQGAIARRFATYGADKFSGVDLVQGPLGQPLLVDALANIECRVLSESVCGTHRVFIAEVAHAEARPGEPLAYYRGQFGHLMHAHELGVYESVRTRVFEGDPEFQQDLTAAKISELLDVPTTAAYYALNRLAAAGTLEADSTTGFFHARPHPMALSDTIYDSRLAIEIGALALVKDRLSTGDIEELVLLVKRIGDTMSAAGVSVARREADQDAFHDRLVQLTHNDSLIELYRRTEVRETSSGFISADEIREMTATYDQITAGLRDHSLESVQDALQKQYRLRKIIARRAVLSTYLLES